MRASLESTVSGHLQFSSTPHPSDSWFPATVSRILASGGVVVCYFGATGKGMTLRSPDMPPGEHPRPCSSRGAKPAKVALATSKKPDFSVSEPFRIHFDYALEGAGKRVVSSAESG